MARSTASPRSLEPSGPLSELDETELRQLLKEYLQNKDENAVLEVNDDTGKIQFCYNELKNTCLQQLEANKKLQEQQQQLQEQLEKAVKKSKVCVIL